MERAAPGTLLNNLSYDLWHARYVEQRHLRAGTVHERRPLLSRQPGQRGGGVPFADWVLGLPIKNIVMKLFGATEDVFFRDEGQAATHEEEMSEFSSGMRVLCPHCVVPLCSYCRVGLTSASGTSNVPMSLANDQWYGYACKLLAERRVTWLECASASLFFSTLLVYYLEAPYGHLMTESMQGAQARTTARGNLFSFMLPWQDIEEQIATAEQAHVKVPLPHDDAILSQLIHVHVVGGTVDLAQHLEGAKLRPAVIKALINELRESGYSAYAVYTEAEIAIRTLELYGSDDKGPFIPARVQKAIQEAHRAKREGVSLIHDKNATPTEPISELSLLEATLRPLQLVAERSSATGSNAQHEYATYLGRFSDLVIQTGSQMQDQFRAPYLGMAHPFTLPVAVGGYDVPGKPRWRRPTDNEVEKLPSMIAHAWPKAFVRTHGAETGAAPVRLSDLTRGLPQRVEAQYRTH